MEGFYGDLDKDKGLACQLVQDLSAKFYQAQLNQKLLCSNFLNTATEPMVLMARPTSHPIIPSRTFRALWTAWT